MENIKKIEPKFYLLLHNIQKKNNIGTLLRSAAAFNICKVFLISKETENTKKKKIMKKFAIFFGAQGTGKKISYEVFPDLKQAKDFFAENNIKVCGVEITENSEKVSDHPFRGDTVFILGNEGSGLIPKLKEICDHFVYIPQFTDKTASLNVAVAGSIIFHHFATWAQYKEVEIFGEKFTDVDKTETPFLDFIIHPSKDSQQNINQEKISNTDNNIDINFDDN